MLVIEQKSLLLYGDIATFRPHRAAVDAAAFRTPGLLGYRPFAGAKTKQRPHPRQGETGAAECGEATGLLVSPLSGFPVGHGSPAADDRRGIPCEDQAPGAARRSSCAVRALPCTVQDWPSDAVPGSSSCQPSWASFRCCGRSGKDQGAGSGLGARRAPSSRNRSNALSFSGSETSIPLRWKSCSRR